MADGRDIGCIAKLESFFSAETGLFCGVWIGIWFYMILQLCAVRHTGQIQRKNRIRRPFKDYSNFKYAYKNLFFDF